jgi:hypothetical protein
MRRKSWRLVIVGVVLVLLSNRVFLFMLDMAPKSNDPATLMRTVGQVSGVVGGIALVMIAFGLIGQKT